MDTREVRLSEPHVAPLMALVREWREREHLEVPNVDPNDGGVDARMLVLLESPGPRAVGTGFVSRDNPDPSARNIGRLLDGAGFARSEVLLWNVVPFCVSTVDRNRNASRAQIVGAVPKTRAFIDRVRDLRIDRLRGQTRADGPAAPARAGRCRLHRYLPSRGDGLQSRRVAGAHARRLRAGAGLHPGISGEEDDAPGPGDPVRRCRGRRRGSG